VLVTSGGVATATFTTANLRVGVHSITVAYSGDTDHATSSSATLALAVAPDAATTAVPAFGTSDLSNPNPAGNRSNLPAIGSRIVNSIAGGSSNRSTIRPGGTEIDLAIEALPADDNGASLTADTSTHDLALEQVSEDAWGRRMSRRWGTGGKSLHWGR
jgi:hypothetical protein